MIDMSPVEVTRSGEVAVVTLCRGKVNALNEATVERLARCFDEVQRESAVRSVVLTGAGKFFSFGFDIPELLPYSREAFTRFLVAFTELYTKLYVFPKPLVAALNGHAVAGGCMLATACDYRVMVRGRAKISLNEITFGSSVFAGSTEMLVEIVGRRNAETILYSGAMYDAEEARGLGLVDDVATDDELMRVATDRARALAGHDAAALSSLKSLTRGPVAERMRSREPDSIREFVEIWYSEATRAKLGKIKIRT